MKISQPHLNGQPMTEAQRGNIDGGPNSGQIRCEKSGMQTGLILFLFDGMNGI